MRIATPTGPLAAALLLILLASAPGAGHAAYDPVEQDLRSLQLAMARGDTTSVALVDAYLARIARYDQQGPALNSISSLNPDARAEAAALDAERARSGPRGPLHGIPVLVKDNYETRGMPTTVGSILLRDFAPDNDAELVRRLRAAGAVILGKTNMHEFADGIETVGSGFGATRNPYDRRRHPGGSSGGTAAAVSASFAAVGMGSDTCGSIRNPSAHNALVGLRGTQGASSRAGIVPLSSTQDIGGPLARSVTDLALVLDATVGYDPNDPQTAASVGRLPSSFTSALHPGALRGVRIGVPKGFVRVERADEEIARVFDAARAELTALGATVVDVSIPDLDTLIHERMDGFFLMSWDFHADIDAYLAAHPDAPVHSLDEIVASHSAHPWLQPLLEEAAALGPRQRPEYLDEMHKRTLLRRAILKVMADGRLDALAYPTIRRKAALLDAQQGGSNCQLAANSGLPAVSVPDGFTPDGLPSGLELLGRPWADADLLGWAFDYEQATRHRRPPDLDTE